jgi:hypothetical protein
MADDILQTRRNIRELTKVGEREIHEVVLSCGFSLSACRVLEIGPNLTVLRNKLAWAASCTSTCLKL